ncbi:MAG: TIGR03560 family F420-dependent LLM class oxidoreductase [Mycobacteriales bacterium]
MIDLALVLDPARRWADTARLAQAVEALGWHGVYVCDHFMPYDVDGAAPAGPVLEAWSTLTGLAGKTERLRLGTLVLGNTYRHPAVVARMAATLDHVSAGRVILGLGAGWQDNEHRALGIALPDVPARMDALEEACEVIVSLLRRPRTSFAGHHYRLIDAPSEPKPVQERLPLLVGGAGEKRTIPIAARWADAWHTWCDPATFRHKLQVLHTACEAIGRDPDQIRPISGDTLDEDGASRVLRLVAQHAAAGSHEFVLRDHRDLPVARVLRELEAITRGLN